MTANPLPYPEPHAPECWATGCKAPGPYKDIPALAAHRWAAHQVEVVDTYAETGYRDEDDPQAGGHSSVAGPLVAAPCGKKVRAGSALGGHKGKCRECRAKTRGLPSVSKFPPPAKPPTPRLAIRKRRQSASKAEPVRSVLADAIGLIGRIEAVAGRYEEVAKDLRATAARLRAS